MALKQGWTGRVFEDFQVGDVRASGRPDGDRGRQYLVHVPYDEHQSNASRRGVLEENAVRTPPGEFMLHPAVVTGQSVIDLTVNGVANLGWDDVRLPNPLFEGDTLYSRSEVLEARESKSKPSVGIVRVKTTGYNQEGVTVIEFNRTFMVHKRGHVPHAPRPAQSQPEAFRPPNAPRPPADSLPWRR